ncbi:SDR family NAD(P)-dependent oxidoreductase [Sodalis sp. RH20]|uniref:SDR family NAD(P)-dependent oxidoreductase n=1 Tax=unclassified Sodalis (in: enterobacteria) TaxID=2636512 RepID=UPI0039B4B1A2
MRLENKTAIVTGAAGGIGRAIADAFAKEGARVLLGDIRSTPYDPLHDRQSYLQFDVSDAVAWDNAIADFYKEYNGIKILVNNAAITNYQPLDEINLDDWNRVISVNQTGPMLGIRAVVPLMRKDGGGSIINITSSWAHVAAPGVAAYHATKGALSMITRNAAVTFAKDKIRVNSIVPGIVRTPLVNAQDPDITASIVNMTPFGLTEPYEIAAGAVFLASDESSAITGSDLMMDGGYTVV